MDKPRFPRSAALAVARELCDALRPACERLIVAGSLRRGKESVGDVEILFVPKTEIRAVDMFDSALFSLADEAIEKLLKSGRITKRANVHGTIAWGAKNKLATHASGVPVDLFTSTAAVWFNYLVCRTGPAESNLQIATRAQERGYKWNPYGAGFTRLSDGQAIPMESEAAVFEFVGLEYRQPAERSEPHAQPAA